MKKLSNINESTWGDMRRRAEGDQIRREDDVNNLDMNELYEHIYELYEQINPYPMPLKSLEDTSDKKIQYFSIPIFKTNYKVYRLDAIFKNDKISVLTLMARDADIKDFKQALIDNFDVTIRSDKALTIEEKDGTLTNQTCMKLISVIVENAPEPYLKKKGLNESTWGDMRKRAEGNQIRREDDINLLDIDGLWGYINDNYKNLSHRETWVSRHDTGSFIHIPMFRRYNKLYSIYLKFKTDKISEIQIEANRKTCSEFISIVEEKYNIDDNGGFGIITITSKTDEFTNQDAIDIINMIIENSTDPAIQKK